MVKHTPEPWHSHNRVGYVFGSDGGRGQVQICTVGGFISDPDCIETSGTRWQADTDRIVVCVNAFSGIPIEHIEGLCFEEFLDLLVNISTRLRAINDGKYNEYTGDLLLREEDWTAINEAYADLRDAVAPFQKGDDQ